MTWLLALCDLTRLQSPYLQNAAAWQFKETVYPGALGEL